MRRKPTLTLLACVSVFVAAVVMSARAASGDGGRTHWTLIDEGEVKLDGKPPIASGVYLPDKKTRKKGTDIVLILLGRRYLMLDAKAKVAYEVLPSDLTAQGKDFESSDLAQESHLIPTTDWSVRDIGPAELIRLTLGDYGRVLEVELPHPPDLRGLYVE